MTDVIRLNALPDLAAQEIWRKVAEDSDTISELMDAIPAITVRGEDTRREMAAAHEALRQAIELLEYVASREVSRYSEADEHRMTASSEVPS